MINIKSSKFHIRFLQYFLLKYDQEYRIINTVYNVARITQISESIVSHYSGVLAINCY